jgi:hypothetical protein
LQDKKGRKLNALSFLLSFEKKDGNVPFYSVLNLGYCSFVKLESLKNYSFRFDSLIMEIPP